MHIDNPAMQMDESDEAILALLAQKARMPVAVVAKKLHLARSTVQARLDRLEAGGVIAGYSVRLGAAARAQRIRGTALLAIEPTALGAIIARLGALPEVTAAHTTSGRFDLLVSLSTGTTEDLDRALDIIAEVPGVRTIETLVHLSTRIDRRTL